MGLRKHVNLASYALGNVLKYRTRSVAVITALIISSSIICSVEFIREGLVVDIENSFDEGPDIIVQRLNAGRQSSIPIEWRSNISQTSGVRMATPRVWGYASIGTGKFITIMGINASEYASVSGAVGTSVSDGRFLENEDSRRIVIGQGVIDMMNAAGAPVRIDIGSYISLIAFNGSLIEFEIVGVFKTDAKIFNYDMIITDIDSARLLFGIDADLCTDFAVWVDYGVFINDVAYRLDNRFPEARILTKDGIRDTTLRVYGDRAGIVALLWVILVFSVIILAFTTSSAISEESRREVGLLKALGFDTVDILEIRTFEGITISILGASMGVSAAIIFDYVLGAPGLSSYLLGWSFLLINSEIPLVISPITVFMVYVVSIVPILIATIIPSWRNAITEPDVVLRGV